MSSHPAMMPLILAQLHIAAIDDEEKAVKVVDKISTFMASLNDINDQCFNRSDDKNGGNKREAPQPTRRQREAARAVAELVEEENGQERDAIGAILRAHVDAWLPPP